MLTHTSWALLHMLQCLCDALLLEQKLIIHSGYRRVNIESIPYVIYIENKQKNQGYPPGCIEDIQGNIRTVVTVTCPSNQVNTLSTWRWKSPVHCLFTQGTGTLAAFPCPGQIELILFVKIPGLCGLRTSHHGYFQGKLVLNTYECINHCRSTNLYYNQMLITSYQPQIQQVNIF